MDFAEIARDVFFLEIEELKRVAARIGPEMDRAVEMIFGTSGKIIVTGIGKTGLIGQKIAASLSSTGTPAFFMNATDAIHGDLGMVGPHDVVIAISNSGSTYEITNILPPLRKIGAQIIAITGNADSRLGKEADLILDVHVESEACPLGLAPTSSTTATLLMGDALIVALMRKRGFRTEEYALYHPGGALGRRLLTRVENLMSSEIPTVQEDDLFKEVVYAVSKFRKGMVMVLNGAGKMSGIITDGDIRRAIQRYEDILSRTAGDLMTHGFKKVAANAQINEALQMMTTAKITSLVVHSPSHADQIVGLLTIHDITQ